MRLVIRKRSKTSKKNITWTIELGIIVVLLIVCVTGYEIGQKKEASDFSLKEAIRSSFEDTLTASFFSVVGFAGSQNQ